MKTHHIAAILSILAASESVAGVEEYCTIKKCVGSRVTALIPARAGSKGIKKKNLSRIGSETLLARTLKTVHEVGLFDSVWVSTDGREIADEAKRHRAEVHWRDPATATDNASTVSVVEDFQRFHPDYDIIAVIQCTSPFLQSQFLQLAIRKMADNNLNCVFSVSRVFHLRWTENEDGFMTPLNFDPLRRPRRQDWNGELIENGMFYFARKELITERKLQNNRCGVVEIPKKFSMEIDTESDLIIARAISKIMEN